MQPIEWPFLAREALGSGALTFRELRRFHEGVYPGVWIPRGVQLSAPERARAAWLWSRRQATIAGVSASALFGAKYVDANEPAELVHQNRRPPRLIVVRSHLLAEHEVTQIAGMAVTTAARTGFDLARTLPLKEGVQRVDELMRTTKVSPADILELAATHPGARGLRQLRQTMDLVDGGSESPYESWTRILLIQAGFPRPETQIDVYDEHGVFVARLDMGWRRYGVGVDFDGADHWADSKQRTKDVERYARLPEVNWIDIRVNAEILHKRPGVFLDHVARALIARGCPKTW